MAKKQSELTPELNNKFTELESQYNLPTGLLKSVAKTESNFNSKALSPVGAHGMFQFMPGTARRFGVNTSDPVSSAEGAAKYFKHLLGMFDGDVSKAIASYNWGEGNVKKKGLTNLPRETQNYLKKVGEGLSDPSSITVSQQISNGDNTRTAGMSQDYVKNSNSDISSANATPEELAAVRAYLAQQGGGNVLRTTADVFSEGDAVNQMNREQADQTAGIQNSAQPNPTDATPEELAAVRAYLAQQQKAPAAVVQQPVQQQVIDPQGQALINEQAAPVIQQSDAVNGIPSQANLSNDPMNGAYWKAPNRSKFISWFTDNVPDDQKGLALEKLTATNPKAAKLVRDYYAYAGTQDANRAGPITNFVQGVANFGNDAALGLGQGIAYAKGKIDGDMTKYNELRDKAANQKGLNELNDLANPSIARTAGEIAPYFAGPSGAAAGASLALKVGSRAALGAGYSALQSSTEDANNFGSDLAKRATIGAVTAPLLGAATDKVGGAIAQRLGSRLPSADEAVQRSAQDINVNLLASELPSANKTLQAAGQDLASTNSKVQSQVKANLDAGKKAAQDFRDQFSGNSYDYINRTKQNILDASSDPVSHYNKEASDLLSKATSTADNDAGNSLRNIVKAEYLNNKIESSKLYQNAADSLPPGYNFDMTNVKKALSDIQVEASKNPSKTIKGNLQSIVNDFDADFSNYPLDNTGVFIKNLNELIGKAKTSQDYAKENALTNLKTAVVKDMNEFANKQAGSGDPLVQRYINAERDARAYNAQAVQSFKNDKSLNSLIDDNSNIDNIVKNVIKNKTQLENLFNSQHISDEAKNAIRFSTANSLVNNATRSNDNLFNPNLYAKEVDKLRKTIGNDNMKVLFGNNANQKLTDMSRVFTQINTFRDYSNSNPQTAAKIYNYVKSKGPQFLAGIAAGGAAGYGSDTSGQALTAAGIGAAVFAASKGRQSMFVNALLDKDKHKLLLDLANTNPKSIKFLDKLSDFMAKAGSAETANNDNVRSVL